MAFKLVRMIRTRILAAMAIVDDWRVDPEKVTRLSDGLWIKLVHGQFGGGHFEVGNSDHGVAQIVVDSDSELDAAYSALMNFHPTSKRQRSILKNLGIESDA